MLQSLRRRLGRLRQASRPWLWDLGHYRRARSRQRRTLTVAMFHRVLPLDGEAYAHAEQEYAVGLEDFDRALAYFQAHYQVVSLGQVREAVEGSTPLPDHALLITFDDGWRDNVEHAQPLLAARGLRATMFVNADALAQPDDRWWQDALVELNMHRPEALTALAGRPDFFAAARGLLQRPLTQRLEALQPWLSYRPSTRQMLTPEELARLDRGVWDIGSHGATHVPMTHVDDLDAELAGSARRLADWAGQPIDSLAFPHGRFTPEIAERAAQAYRLVFTSETVLNDSRERVPRRLGRIHIPALACRDDKAMGLLLWARRTR